MTRCCLCLLLLSLIAGCSDSPNAVYPSAPFAPVAEGFPEVLALEEEPSDADEAAYDAYWEQREAVHTKALEATILANASDQERDLFKACWNSEYVTARNLADALLQTDPFSLVGLYGMAQVEAYAESDLPYALNLIRAARHQAEVMGHEDPQNPIGQEWYLRTLETEYEILSLMGRSPEMLVIVDRMETVYGRSMPWLRMWPLIKMKNEVEAREAIQVTLRGGNFVDTATNMLGCLEDKMHNTDPSLAVFRRLAEERPESALAWNNAGLAEANAMRFDRAEEAFLKSVEASDQNFYGTGYIPLATLYLQQGRIAEALDSLKQAQSARGEREAHSLQQDEAHINCVIASLMLAMGETDRAVRFAQSASQAPDRDGKTSNRLHDIELTNALMLWVCSQTKSQEWRDAASIRRLTLQEQTQRVGVEGERMRAHRRILDMVDAQTLYNLIRPYRPGTAGVETGLESRLRFAVFAVLPTGVTRQAIHDVRQQGIQESEAPYVDAWEAFVLLRAGRYKQASFLAQGALERLNPKAEKVLRAHVSAIAGQAAWKLQQPDAAIAFWATTLRDFPQAFRLFEMQLPIQIVTPSAVTQSEDVAAVQKLLSRSTRFFASPHGFPLSGQVLRDHLVIELFQSNGTRQLEAVVPMASDLGSVDIRAASAFFDVFFQSLVELTQADMGSLDGSPIAQRLGKEVDGLFADFIEMAKE